jgi:hypothetical protein
MYILSHQPLAKPVTLIPTGISLTAANLISGAMRALHWARDRERASKAPTTLSITVNGTKGGKGSNLRLLVAGLNCLSWLLVQRDGTAL